LGEAGVGKTAIAEGLAQAIHAGEVPKQLHGKRIIALDMPGMLAGTRYRGDFEERLTGALNEIAEDGDMIVFVDERHTLVRARGDLHMIGASTLKEYRAIEKDSALERRFQPVTVGEPSVEAAVTILEGLKDRYAELHEVTYTAEAVRAAVELSNPYITDRFLPDKAIDLIDQAGARMSLARAPGVDVEALKRNLSELEAEKKSAIEAEDYERAGRVRDAITERTARIESAETPDAQAAQTAASEAIIGEEEIAQVVCRATGIPAARMTQSQKVRLANMEEVLHDR